MTDEEKLAEEYRKELKERLIRDDDFERLEMFDENVEEAYLAGRKSNSEVITELAKENAELKLRLEALEGQTPWKDIKDKSEVIGQLTKAKEIIKYLLSFIQKENYRTRWNINITEAEQFLKEVEDD